MKNQIFRFISYGKMSIEKCEGYKPCLAREIRLEENKCLPVNKFIGTVYDDNAMQDLHKGDIVEAIPNFSIHKKGGKWIQRIVFSNLKKIGNKETW